MVAAARVEVFEWSENGLAEPAEANGLAATAPFWVVEGLDALAKGFVVTALVVCARVAKGLEAAPAGAAGAAAKGLFIVASLFAVLDPPKVPPLLDAAALRPFVASLGAPKIEDGWDGWKELLGNTVGAPKADGCGEDEEWLDGAPNGDGDEDAGLVGSAASACAPNTGA